MTALQRHCFRVRTMSFLKSLFGSKRSANVDDSAVRGFILLLLFRALLDGATDLLIGAAPSGPETPLRHKIGGNWRGLPSFPARIRGDVLVELARMAGLPAGQFPIRGVLDVWFNDS